MTIPDPVPLDDDLRCFPRTWFDNLVLRSAEWRRLQRREPVVALALISMHAAAQWEPGCGLEDDDDALAYAAGLWPQNWEEHGPSIRRHLVKGESGRVYVRLFLGSLQAAYAIKQERREQTAPAREALAAKREAERAAKAAAAEARRRAAEQAKARADSPARTPPPEQQPTTVPEPVLDVSETNLSICQSKNLRPEGGAGETVDGAPAEQPAGTPAEQTVGVMRASRAAAFSTRLALPAWMASAL